MTIPSGYYLSYWNTPLISYASTDAAVTDKSVYDTVIRMGEGYKEIGHAFVEVTFILKFTSLYIIYLLGF